MTAKLVKTEQSEYPSPRASAERHGVNPNGTNVSVQPQSLVINQFSIFGGHRLNIGGSGQSNLSEPKERKTLGGVAEKAIITTLVLVLTFAHAAKIGGEAIGELHLIPEAGAAEPTRDEQQLTVGPVRPNTAKSVKPKKPKKSIQKGKTGKQSAKSTKKT